MPASRSLRPLALAAIAGALTLGAVGCANAVKGASGSFRPRTANTLTVATAQIPDPGFWAGTFAHPTGGFEYGLAKQLAARLHLARVKVVEVPFHELVRGHLGGADLALSDITITDERAQHLDFSTSRRAAGHGGGRRQRRPRLALGRAARRDVESGAG